MPDPHEPTGKNVQRKATDKLHGFQSHHILLCSLSVVLKPARNLCTTNPAGRLIERSQYATAVEKNARNLTKQRELYKERQQLIEHVFGTIKRQWSFDHILRKGIRKNNGEMGLIYFIYNFRRYMNILSEKLAKKAGKLTGFLLLRTLITTTRVTMISKWENIYMPLTPRVGNRRWNFGYCTHAPAHPGN